MVKVGVSQSLSGCARSSLSFVDFKVKKVCMRAYRESDIAVINFFDPPYFFICQNYPQSTLSIQKEPSGTLYTLNMLVVDQCNITPVCRVVRSYLIATINVNKLRPVLFASP